VTAQDITAIGKIYTLLTNPARLYRDEILDNNQWVETTIGGGYECVSYAYAGNSEDANTQPICNLLTALQRGSALRAAQAVTWRTIQTLLLSTLSASTAYLPRLH